MKIILPNYEKWTIRIGRKYAWFRIFFKTSKGRIALPFVISGPHLTRSDGTLVYPIGYTYYEAETARKEVKSE